MWSFPSTNVFSARKARLAPGAAPCWLGPPRRNRPRKLSPLAGALIQGLSGSRSWISRPFALSIGFPMLPWKDVSPRVLAQSCHALPLGVPKAGSLGGARQSALALIVSRNSARIRYWFLKRMMNIGAAAHQHGACASLKFLKFPGDSTGFFQVNMISPAMCRPIKSRWWNAIRVLRFWEAPSTISANSLSIRRIPCLLMRASAAP